MDNIFFIIGAQRSGTSYLAGILNNHPQIRMTIPMFPEPKFFLSPDEYSKGKEYYFEKYYSEIEKVKWLGEKSTSYIESEQAGQRMKAMFPDSRIIVQLRNPIQRAVSNYFYTKGNGIETRTLREVFIEKKPLLLEEKKYSVSPINYLGRGEYLKYLKPYFKIFGKDRIKVIIFEKMISEQNEIDLLFQFLNLEATPFNKMDININASMKSGGIDNEVLEHLKNYYRKHIHELESFLNINLSIWK